MGPYWLLLAICRHLRLTTVSLQQVEMALTTKHYPYQDHILIDSVSPSGKLQPFCRETSTRSADCPKHTLLSFKKSLHGRCHKLRTQSFAYHCASWITNLEEQSNKPKLPNSLQSRFAVDSQM
jgi:hypothetical protein